MALAHISKVRIGDRPFRTVVKKMNILITKVDWFVNSNGQDVMIYDYVITDHFGNMIFAATADGITELKFEISEAIGQYRHDKTFVVGRDWRR